MEIILHKNERVKWIYFDTNFEFMAKNMSFSAYSTDNNVLLILVFPVGMFNIIGIFDIIDIFGIPVYNLRYPMFIIKFLKSLS